MSTDDRRFDEALDAKTLRRLGQELAKVYGDVLTGPLPPPLQRLSERLADQHDSAVRKPNAG